MSTPLFSQADKASFSDVSFKMNEYMHHLKYFDRIEDVTDQLLAFKNKMEKASTAVHSIFGITSDIKESEKNKWKENLETIVNDHLRKNISITDHIWGIFQYLKGVPEFKYLPINKIENPKNLVEYLKTSNKNKAEQNIGKDFFYIDSFYKDVLELRQARLDCVELLKKYYCKTQKITRRER